MSLKHTLPILLSVFLPFLTFSQQALNLGDWRDHLPYNSCTGLAQSGSVIYVATPYSVFTFDKGDQSLTRMNKVTGLSDVSVSAIAFSEELGTLVIAYGNANLDLVKEGAVVNIPDIKRKQIMGDKTIHSILLKGKFAYLSCGFGIVVLDIGREEINDTWYIGPGGTQVGVNALTYHAGEDMFYAATESGIYKADAQSNLAYFMNWHKESGFPGEDHNFNLIASFAGKLYGNSTPTTSSFSQDTMYVKESGTWQYFEPSNTSNRTSIRVSNNKLLICNYLSVDLLNENGTHGTLYWTYNPGFIRPNDAFFDEDNVLWVADNDNGLYHIGSDFIGQQILLNGPLSADVSAMSVVGKTIWAVPGGRNGSFGNLYRHAQFSVYNGEWNTWNRSSEPWMEEIRDVLCVAADPNDAGHAFMGTWGYNLIEFKDGELVKIHTPENSALRPSVNASELVFVGGLAFDAGHNLWATNSTAANILCVMKNTGEWKSYNLGTYGTAVDVGGIVIDHSGQKWMQMRDLSLLVFNDNNTLDNTGDDQVKKLTSAPGNGNLHGNGVACMAVDHNGQLWMGTDQGVIVIYSPEAVFSGGNYDAQQVMVEEEGYLHPLLETEIVTAIAVNGNNQKWLGTDKSGVFLMSSDGTEQIYHFTEENSPLLSNSITSIQITTDGEVVFGTQKGIVSYRDYSISPLQSLDSVYVYPNPVREGYKGPISITNLSADANIKITDVSGNLVWETQGEGGRVIWDGNDLNGRRVNTGVYLVFITNPDGSQKKVAKVMVIQ